MDGACDCARFTAQRSCVGVASGAASFAPFASIDVRGAASVAGATVGAFTVAAIEAAAVVAPGAAFGS